MVVNKKSFFAHLFVVLVVASIVSIVYTKSQAVGGSWVNVGNAGFSAGAVEQTSLVIDSDLNQYVAFRDNSKGGKMTVMKYDASLASPKWINVGKPGFTPGAVGGTQNDYFFSLKLDSKGTPYVAFLDTKNNKSVSVMKYNGKAWVSVGKAGFTSSKLTHVAFGIDSKDLLYIAFPDTSSGNNMTVMNYDSKLPATNWNFVGNPGFSGRGGSMYPTIAFNSNDVPFVGYADVDGKATVKKFDSSVPKWIDVGIPSFSVDGVWSTTLAIDSNDAPYLAFADNANGNKATVMKYDGAKWVNLGKPGFSPSTAFYPSFALDYKNTPYIGFMDQGNSFKATVMKYDGSEWATVGLPGFSPSTVWNTSLALDSSGEVYISFKDADQKNKLTVMKYEGDGKSCENDILTFSIAGKQGVIDQTSRTIDIRVPYGSKITSLTPSLLLSDYATVSPKSNAVNNFTKNKYYVVKGQNKSCVKTYEVNVTVNSWEEVGTPGFSQGEVRYVSTALDSKGVPYVAFSEDTGSTYNDMSVIKYNSATKAWENVGSRGFTPGEATEGAMAINPKSGVPYVAFTDGTKNLKLSVMLYDSSSSNWYNVGSSGFSDGQVQWVNIAFDSSGKPYVAFAEHDGGKTSLKVSVMKYEGTNWVFVGSSRFAGSDTKGEDVSYLGITFDKNNMPYIVYVGHNGKPTVMKSNGKAWSVVGDSSFTSDKAENTTIAISTSGVPHIAFKDSSVENKASVMKYDAVKNKWSYVGSAGFSKTEAYDTAIKFFGNIPYVAYNSEWESGAYSNVMKLNGSNWVSVGNPDFSDGQTTLTSMSISKSGVPYVAYKDIYNKYKVTMMRHP